eukprot:21998-Prorocentrum_minimum.AAC.1
MESAESRMPGGMDTACGRDTASRAGPRGEGEEGAEAITLSEMREGGTRGRKEGLVLVLVLGPLERTGLMISWVAPLANSARRCAPPLAGVDRLDPIPEAEGEGMPSEEAAGLSACGR